MHEPPRISVITAIYNAEDFLERTLQSLINQTFQDFEVIIVDDGSTDTSTEIVERLAEGEPRIRLIRQKNRGIAHALNRGISESRGELIALLDHDDLWRPKKLALQVERIDRDHSVGFVGCYSALIDDDGNCLGWRFGTHVEGAVYREMRYCDLIAGGSVPLVRRTLFEQAGNFDPAPEIQGRTDWEQWIRLSRFSNYAMVRSTLVGYARRPSNYSRDYHRMVEAGKAVLFKTAASDPDFDLKSLVKAQARDVFGVFCLGFADEEIDSIGCLLRRSIQLSWQPILLSPRRLLVVALFLLAKITPRAHFRKIWRFVATVVFRLKPGEPFLPEQVR